VIVHSWKKNPRTVKRGWIGGNPRYQREQETQVINFIKWYLTRWRAEKRLATLKGMVR
jgi:hypothetical protein